MDNDTEQNYRENLLYLMDLCRTLFGDTMKQYYEGDPIVIPIANLPCIIIEKTGTTVNVDDAPTGHDAVTETITIRVVFNKLDDTGEDGNGVDDSYDLTERKLRKLVEGRDPATGQFASNSLMHALRTDISLGQTVRDQSLQIVYGVNPRTTDLLTSEAEVTITISEIIQVNNRV